jgi:hypothetical protein
MNPLQNRTCLVSFRLTPDELENLRGACLLHGARNVSDFARGAVLHLAELREAPEAKLLERFVTVEGRLSEMQHTLRHTTELLRGLARSIAARDRSDRDDRKDEIEGMATHA